MSGILLYKDVRARKISADFQYKQYRLKVKCDSYHVIKQTERCIGRMKNPNIEKLSLGWVIKKKVFGSCNQMRANVVDLITDPAYGTLCDYLVLNKAPKLLPTPTEDEIKDLIGKTYSLNQDQFSCI